MSYEAYVILAIILGLFGLLIKTKLPPAAIFMGALTLAITFKLAPAKELLHGFSNSGMVADQIAKNDPTAPAMRAIQMFDPAFVAIPVTLAAVFVGAVFLSNFIAHAAAVALMFPIAMSMATDLGASFMPFAIIIMLGASYSFISPTGYQTNLMVYGPGGYKFTDFFKIGIPLTIVVGILTVFFDTIVFQTLKMKFPLKEQANHV